ncbi:HAMP domain-containing protein [Sphingomonas populi]|uniref:histidine kinase n=1 Tax=Sphingomonas populi TaxID=2484750 RepID=A0A4Q6XVX4_9SPHN|nr:ATP-binding protein [Sphingomonas populi]RZF61089.1 HAMP domain-containing protein [Sphingomonas populi]
MRGTLSFRIGAILLVGFVLLQLLQLATLQLPGRIGDRGFYGLPSPPAFAELVRSVEAAGPEGGKRLVENFNGSLFSVEIRGTPLPDFREVPASMRPLAIAYRRALPDHNVVVDGGPGRFNGLLGDRARPLRFLVPIRLTIWLRDGDVLVLTGRPADGLRAYLAHRSQIGLIGGALLLALLWLALRQTTRPLQRLTQGVRALGRDLHADDVSPEGSGEVRALASAFNDMKHRIARLVEERTFMLAGIAHDMRTYLTRLQLRAEFIGDAEQRARAVRDLEQMSRLLDDSLLFASIGPQRRETAGPVDLSALTRDLAARHGCDGHIDLDLPETCIIRGDPATLERIFGNLVDNALRYAGTVTIRIERRDGLILWTFADDGPGVDPADLALLGTAYARLDPSRDRRTGGTGLGLAIVRALTEAMEGTISFQSQAGQGLTVQIAFARCHQTAAD